MTYANPQALIETAALADLIDSDAVVVFDGTSHLPTTGRDAAAEFAIKHIPGALRFDIDDICDKQASLPHMLPSPEVFASQMSALGVANGDRVVVYDVYGMQSAARVWWMFRIFGHDNVAVLNGGLPKWYTEGRAVTAEVSSRAATTYTASFRPPLVRNIDDVLQSVEHGHEQIVDARSAGRFTAAEPEPRSGMRSGHMPGAINLPFTDLLDGPCRVYRDADAIGARISKAGIDLDRPVTTSCGSGVTACALLLGMFLIGKEDVAVYDGSWTEWGGRADTPVATDCRDHGPEPDAGQQGSAAGSIATLVTYLEMLSPPNRPPAPPPAHIGTTLTRIEKPTVAFYRFLYNSVGAPWTWVERRLLDDATLSAAITAPGVEIHVLHTDGGPAGYGELDHGLRKGEVNLAYFGLMPDVIGKGLGRYFLDAMIDLAWSGGPERVWVHTCDLDHPRALDIYRRAGFTVYAQHEERLPDPRAAGLPLPSGRAVRPG